MTIYYAKNDKEDNNRLKCKGNYINNAETVDSYFLICIEIKNDIKDIYYVIFKRLDIKEEEGLLTQIRLRLMSKESSLKIVKKLMGDIK